MKSFFREELIFGFFLWLYQGIKNAINLFFFSLFFFLHEVEALLKKNKKKTSWQELALSTDKCE